MKIKIALLSCIFLVVFLPLLGQQTIRRPSGIIPYLEYLPPSYTSDGYKHPVLLFMHGFGERGSGSDSDFEKVKKNGPPKHIKNGHDMCFEIDGVTDCFVVISPQTNRSTWQPFEVHPLVDYIIENYNVDPSRVYLTGLSMGGRGAYDQLYDPRNETNKFAAVVPVAASARINLVCDYPPWRVPVWHHHGDKDNTVHSYGNGLLAIEAINECDPDPEPMLRTYVNVGHNCWDRTYKTDNSENNPNIYQWLLSHSLDGNQKPNVSAGTDVTIVLPLNSLEVNGSATDADGTIQSVLWTKISGPASTIVNANQLSTWITDLVEGTYEFKLTATDNDGGQGSDIIKIIVLPEEVNIPPTVDAGQDQLIFIPDTTIVLAGSANDTDGTISSFLWTQESGDPSNLINETTSVLTVTGLKYGDYSFGLLVEDDKGATAYDEVIVVVDSANLPPFVNAGADVSIKLPQNSITIFAVSSDPDGVVVKFLWEKISGPLASMSGQNTSTLVLNELIEGLYTFRITVTDNEGATTSDDINIVVNAGNIPPVADAGEDQIIFLPTNFITIEGSAFDSDGSVETYLWEKISGPIGEVLSNDNTPNVTISNLSEGIYIFGFTVTDNEGSTDYDEMNLSVIDANQPPIIDAGPDISFKLPQDSVSIIATAHDIDGSIISYSWKKISGPFASIHDAQSQMLILNDLVAGTYEFSVTVYDDDSASSTDNVYVDVLNSNIPPVANAGPDITIKLPQTTMTINGAGSDADGDVIQYYWELVSGGNASIIDPESSVLNIEVLEIGEYVLGLTVTDNDSATGYDEMKLTVDTANIFPVVNAGEDQIIYLPTNSIVISATATDADGFIESYNWEKLSGGNALIISQSEASTIIKDLEEGIYHFIISVIDNDGAIDSDTLLINVSNQNIPPIANAGSYVTIYQPQNMYTIYGSGFDEDGFIESYYWETIVGDSLILENSNTATVTVKNIREGSYKIRLTVEDNWGASNYDEIWITSLPEDSNIPPSVDAGNDVSISLPIDSLLINANASDPDGTVESFLWEKVLGPTADLFNIDKETLTIKNLSSGVYKFRITVADDDGDSNFDELLVTVFPEDVNQSPTVDAGNNFEVTLPKDSIVLVANANDPDGSINSYNWEVITNPNNFELFNSNTNQLTVKGLSEGFFTFRINVEDDEGATAFDEVTINFRTGNVPPSVDLGEDIILSLPKNDTILVARATDVDGSIDSYDWKLIAGPNSPLFISLNDSTVQIRDMIEGVYSVSMTVTDNDGASATDEIRIFVEAENQSPNVSAGSDITLQLPTNSIVLNGSAMDSDGIIVSYEWTKISGGSATLNNSNTANLSVSGLEEGTYTFRLQVEDDGGSNNFDDVNVFVLGENANVPPTAYAGENIEVILPINKVIIPGVGSDSDGEIVSYEWRKISGPSATIVNGDQATVTLQDLEEGFYRIRLIVVDNDGASNSDDVQVKVLPEVNNAPSAMAGPDLEIYLPNAQVTINGAGSDADGEVISYVWLQIAGQESTILNSNTSTPTITALEGGSYTYRLTVLDDDSASAFDDMNITVFPEDSNQPPLVEAGENQILVLPLNSTTLHGIASDVDGTIEDYLWSKLSGPQADLNGINSYKLEITNLQEGIYNFRLEAVDNRGRSGFDDVSVTVLPPEINLPPIVDGGEDQTIKLPTNSISISSTIYDPDGDIDSILWTNETSLPAELININSRSVFITNLVQGEYRFRVTAIDNDGATTFDEVLVNVISEEDNLPPNAYAGNDTTYKLPVERIYLSGIGDDPDGFIESFLWQKISGPSITLSQSDSSIAILTAIQSGSYRFRLTISDDNEAVGSDEIQIIVLSEEENLPPFVDAGDKTIIYLPTNTSKLIGTTYDVDGSVTAYRWSKNMGGNATIEDPDALATNVSNLEQGIYEFELNVYDDDSATNSDVKVVEVLPANANRPPIADAGENIVVIYPENSIILNGKAYDEDGFITSYHWDKISGGAANIVTPASASTIVSGLDIGTYTFRFTIIDNNSGVGNDEVIVYVLDQGTNQAPKVQIVDESPYQLPIDSIVFKSIASDPDGIIVDYLWQQTLGQNLSLHVDQNEHLILTDLSVGTFRIKLTVTDNNGASSSDEIIFDIKDSTDLKAPISDAGEDIVAKLPLDTLTIVGSGSDIDGVIIEYRWRKMSGPVVNILRDNSQELVLSDLAIGEYIFLLQVTDNDNLSALDTMSLTVQSENYNISPIAMAGDDQSITLPVDSIVLTGYGFDQDGYIQNHEWTQLNGPTISIQYISDSSISISELVSGEYEFNLKVTDDQNAEGNDQVAITVYPEDEINLPPTIFVPSYNKFEFPVVNEHIVARISDDDGYIIDRYWTQINNSILGDTLRSDSLSLTNLSIGKYFFQITAIDNFNQENFEEIEVVVTSGDVSLVNVPKAFSPDGNMINDELIIENVQSLNECTFIVFNNNGQKVYEARPYNNDWNGTVGGSPLPDGDYYYVFICDGKTSKSGGFLIVRK